MRALQPKSGHRPLSIQEDHPDYELVRALVEGKDSAMKELIENYRDAVWKIINIHIKRDEVGEEIMQEVWISVLNGVNGFKGNSKLMTWICRIARNRAINAAKREEKAVLLENPYEFGEKMDRANIERNPPWDLGSQIDARMMLARIDELITSGILNKKEGEVLKMRAVRMGQAEISAKLGITDVHVRVILWKAKQKLREAL